ncbi:unnamed protein product [marine sediment metagenome]|uniref:Uncharacterized protein n=1 Tax=marine sediment metagenome TaxID=412755 RepID=X1RD99_9ZZZZ
MGSISEKISLTPLCLKLIANLYFSGEALSWGSCITRCITEPTIIPIAMLNIPRLEKSKITKITVITFSTKGAREEIVKILCEFNIPVTRPDKDIRTRENIIIRFITINLYTSNWLFAIFERIAPISGERIKITAEITKNTTTIIFTTELTNIFKSSFWFLFKYVE